MSSQNVFTDTRARTASRLLKSVVGFGMLSALRFGPAGVAAWALKSVSRRPLKFLIVVALEPALTSLARRLQTRFNIH